MVHTKWCRLVEATRLAGLSQNVLYRLAAIGRVKTRRGDDGRLEFLVADLERLAGNRAVSV